MIEKFEKCPTCSAKTFLSAPYGDWQQSLQQGLTGDVMLGGRLAVQAVEVSVPVRLRGVDPIAHGKALERLRHGRCGGQGAVRVLLRAHRPREGTGARIGRMSAMVGHGRHP